MHKSYENINRLKDTYHIMMKEAFVVLVVCALIFTTVEAQTGIGDAIRDFINRGLNKEEGKEEITPIKDILENPEEYNNKTVTVEGILGQRLGYASGHDAVYIHGIYDFENAEELEEYLKEMRKWALKWKLDAWLSDPANLKGISVNLKPDLEKLGSAAQVKWVTSMNGKKVRVTGVIMTYYMTYFGEPVPLLAATSDTIEVIE